MYLSCLFISVFFFVCLFQFLDSPSQKFTLSNFDQEVAFNQYFYLYQEFMFVVCFFVYLSACFWCLDYSRTNEQIFIKNLWVGPGERKKLLIFGKDVDHILDTKKSWIFIGPISMYFNDFSFLLHISSKVINKFWCQIWSRKGLAMGRSDYSLGKIQLIYWIPRSLQNYCDNNCCKTKPG